MALATSRVNCLEICQSRTNSVMSITGFTLAICAPATAAQASNTTPTKPRREFITHPPVHCHSEPDSRRARTGCVTLYEPVLSGSPIFLALHPLADAGGGEGNAVVG